MGGLVSSRRVRVKDSCPPSPSDDASDSSQYSRTHHLFGAGAGISRRVSFVIGLQEARGHPADVGVPFAPAPLALSFSAALPPDVAAGAWRAEPKPPRSRSSAYHEGRAWSSLGFCALDRPPDHLEHIALRLLDSADALGEARVGEGPLRALVSRARELHHELPFHGFAKAVDAMQLAWLLAQQPSARAALGRSEVLALLLAALLHRADHPGLSNAFLRAARHPLAAREPPAAEWPSPDGTTAGASSTSSEAAGEASAASPSALPCGPLEAHHAQVAAALLLRPETDVLAAAEPDCAQRVRGRVDALIRAAGSDAHAEWLARTRALLDGTNPPESPATSEEPAASFSAYVARFSSRGSREEGALALPGSLLRRRPSAGAPRPNMLAALCRDGRSTDGLLLLLRAATLAPGCRSPLVNERWAARRAQEAARQWRLEGSLGLPQTERLDPARAWAEEEAAHLRETVRPTLDLLALCVPEARALLGHCEANLVHWELVAAGARGRAPGAEGRFQQRPSTAPPERVSTGSASPPRARARRRSSLRPAAASALAVRFADAPGPIRASATGGACSLPSAAGSARNSSASSESRSGSARPRLQTGELGARPAAAASMMARPRLHSVEAAAQPACTTAAGRIARPRLRSVEAAARAAGTPAAGMLARSQLQT